MKLKILGAAVVFALIADAALARQASSTSQSIYCATRQPGVPFSGIATPVLGASGGGEAVGTVGSITLADATLTMYHEDAYAAHAEILLLGNGTAVFFGQPTRRLHHDTAPTSMERARSC